MCIVIDANTLAPVFNENCQTHPNFKPVRDWITEGEGCLVYGGTKYKEELKRSWRYLRLVRQLKDANRAREIDEAEVDKKQVEICDLTCGTDCDDQHIISLLCVSGCMLLCSEDARAIPFLRDNRFFPTRRQRPRIYRSKRNANLLCRNFIVKLRHVV
jgi:hypothetical protein